MLRPPDPETRSRPAGHGTAYRKTNFNEQNEPSETLSEIQARNLRGLYFFCQDTAYAIAALAFAGGLR